MQLKVKLKILSLNCFGVPFVSPEPVRRIEKIALEILQLSPDLVLLQEVFRSHYKKILTKALGKVYPYSFSPHRGFFRLGGGLVVFSKVPINNRSFAEFKKRGTWHDLTFSDYLACKGFMKFNLNYNHQALVIYHTHLTSNYKADFTKGLHFDFQQAQLKQLAASINQVSLAQPCLIVGDFNVPNSTVLFKNFLAEIRATELVDSDRVTSFTDVFNLPKFIQNLYVSQKDDYVLWRNSQKPECRWQFVFEGRKLSDHIGLLVELAM
jgi:endonuclease/exonuclease/phosphatase (EEP) superfamily protein YafD